MNKFWEKVSKSLAKNSVEGAGGCVLWIGSRDGHGYGKKKLKWPDLEVQKVERVHRVAYCLKNRLIRLPHTDEEGTLLDVSHIYHNKLCINPDHLVLETHHFNMSRIHCHFSGTCSLEHSPPCLL